nr:uncharacterized protein LOC123771992 [Procambarus clarkii]
MWLYTIPSLRPIPDPGRHIPSAIHSQGLVRILVYLTLHLCFRYGRRSNWFKIHCLLDDSRSSPPGTPTDLGGEEGCWGRAASEDNDTIDVCSIDVPDHSPRRTSPALSSPDSHTSDNSVEAALRGPPALEYFSLYPKLLPSSGLYPGPHLNPLLLSRFPLSVSAYSSHSFDPYLQHAFESTRPKLSGYNLGYTTHSLDPRRSHAPAQYFPIPPKRPAEDSFVLPPIKRVRQVMEDVAELSNNSLLSSSTKLSVKFASLEEMKGYQSPAENRPFQDEKTLMSDREGSKDDDTPMDLTVKPSASLSYNRWLETRSNAMSSDILDLSLKNRTTLRDPTPKAHESIGEKLADNLTEGESKEGVTLSSTVVGASVKLSCLITSNRVGNSPGNTSSLGTSPAPLSLM